MKGIFTHALFGALLGTCALAGAAVRAGDALPVQDADFGCTPAATADRYLRDFGVDVASFGGRELCDPARDTKKLLNDITLIEQGRFAEGRTNPFLKNFVAAGNYYPWAVSMTRGVRRGHDIPYATAYNSGGYFTMQDGWAALSTLGRVGTFIHEARHTAGYRHAICTNGPYVNSSVSGCDTTLESGGSHGVEMEYYARVVVQGMNFHPVYATMARLMAIGRSNWVFNRPAIARREALVAIDTRDGNPVLIDGARMLERVGPAAGDSRLKRTSFGATLFDGRRARGLDLYATGQGPEALQDDYSYYKLLNRAADQLSGLRDLEEFDVGNVRFFVALDSAGKLYKYDFPTASWTAQGATQPVAAAERLVTVAPDGTRGVFVLAEGGRVFPYDVAAHRIGAALSARWPSDVRNFQKFGERFVVLKTDGRAFELRGANQDWTPLAGFEERALDQIATAPLYDAFEVSP